MIPDSQTDPKGKKSSPSVKIVKKLKPSLRLLIENSPVDLLLVGLSGEILYSTCDLGGNPKKSLIGIPIYQFVEPRYLNHLRKRLQQAQVSGQVSKFACMLKSPTGRPGLHLIRVRPVMISGRTASFCISLTEIKRPHPTHPIHRKKTRQREDVLPRADHRVQTQGSTPRSVRYISLCSFCKSVKNEQGEWDRIENYLANRSSDPQTEVKISHGICIQCMKQHYPHIRMKQ